MEHKVFRGFGRIYETINVNGTMSYNPEDLGFACRAYVDRLVARKGGSFGIAPTELTPYIHYLRDHIWELTKKNEGRGLRVFKTSNQERANLSHSKHLRQASSRHKDTECLEMLLSDLRPLVSNIKLRPDPQWICNVCGKKFYKRKADYLKCCAAAHIGPQLPWLMRRNTRRPLKDIGPTQASGPVDEAKEKARKPPPRKKAETDTRGTGWTAKRTKKFAANGRRIGK